MIELPAEVDVSRSVAVLSDGLIAIRMPKLIGNTRTQDDRKL
jgi:HSP20 family molecular chaperone IbpA